MRSGDVPHPAQVHRVAGEVGGMGAADGPGVGGHERLEVLVPDGARPVRRDKGEPCPGILQPVERAQDAVVLQVGADEVIPGTEESGKRQV
ncbi:hypothetical protein SDC9_208922 [bioreactor metagenome]|uniref:Uncharacterized protein n=1 Tax=bioreactor metagenome TaxID=1076179 RepID=A0A645JBX5_9ZZZZ